MAARIKQPGATGKISGLCLAALLAFGLPSQPIAAAGPQESVRAFYGVLLSNMRDGRMLGETGRYARLAPVVDRTFDIPSMTRLALGPTWGSLDAPQQQELIAAFAHYVAATYADQFDAYSGEQLEVTGVRPYGTDLMVQTRIVKADGETTRLDYLIRQGRISDVYLDGTISQLAVHRSEFHSILRQQGVDGLVAVLNQKVDLLKSVARAS
jgi:phospholipid transport system substrate-binding protein